MLGTPFATVGGNPFQGATYVFTRSGTSWSQQAKLTASDGAGFDEFGLASALSGDTVLVGALGATINDNPAQGAAYEFTRAGTSWTERSKLTASDGGFPDEFGTGTALAEDTALVSAVQATVGGNPGQGAGYVFRLTPLLTSVAPGSGSTNGGTAMTIVAPNAASATSVTFGGAALGAAAVSSVAVNGDVVTGTTPPHPAGSVDVVLTNPSGLSATLANAFTFVCPAIVVGPATLPGGAQGMGYSQPLTQSGSLVAVTFAVTSGAAPAGLTLSSGGVLSGTPTQADTFSIFTVTATDANGCTGSTTYLVGMVCPTTTACFTDEPLVAGLTPIKIVHISELRDRIDVDRHAIGLPPMTWTDPVLRPGVLALASQYLIELRSALDKAYQVAGLPLPIYTDPTIVPGQTGVRAAQIEELRAAVIIFERARGIM